MADRTDAFGRAYAGSQLQIQTYVNRRRAELDDAIRQAFPELANATIQWVSPLEEERFAEYRDEAFLNALSLTELAGLLAQFWPQGGPQWDALGRVHWPEDRSRAPGVLLVEAKSYPREMYASGSRATGADSRTRIGESSNVARRWFGADPGAADWDGPLYQFANRLAHLYWFRQCAEVEAWFAHVCFTGDSHSPTPKSVWHDALSDAHKLLGMSDSIPFYADILVEAAGRELFQTAPSPRVNSRIIRASVAPERNKDWRFRRDDRFGRHLFLAFANVHPSSSLRYFDASTGVRLGDPRFGRGRNYQDAFAREVSDTQRVDGPPGVDLAQIPYARLQSMRAQAGLDALSQAPEAGQPRPSLLAGLDAIVDRHLRIEDIGQPPHYRHLTTYRRVANNWQFDGARMLQEAYARIVSNWPRSRCRGHENWRWEKKTYIAEYNDSPEKRFEKAVVVQCPDWVNMVPVASGVLPDVEEGGRRIDLVHRCDPAWYEFVELKLGANCNTPLHAAIEILGYGLIYLFSRRNRNALGYDESNALLSARRIDLKALAPNESYSSGSLAVFEREIRRGLEALATKAEGLEMTFRFEQFANGLEVGEASACAAMNGRVAVYDKPDFTA
jgi:hypothetical protein